MKLTYQFQNHYAIVTIAGGFFDSKREDGVIK